MNLPSSQNPSGLNPAMQDPLAQLRDIHLPTDISQWPLAMGWNILILLIATLLITGAFLAFRYWGASRYKRETLKELQTIQLNYKNKTTDAQESARALSNLLKRFALSLYPRSKIAPLYGKQWLVFLDELSQSHFFSTQEGQILGDELFKKSLAENVEQTKKHQSQVEKTLEFSAQFIAQHNVKWGFGRD